MRPIPTIGLFTRGLENQIYNYKKYGYIIVKRNSLISTALVNKSKDDILSYFNSIERKWSYRFWRHFNHVNSQKRRHSIELPSNITSVQTLLQLSIGSIRNLLESQLCQNSPLVEMSAVISKPGSNDQSIHSDISCDINSDLISCFVAMQKIRLENGPTYLYSESHTNDFHKYRDSIVPKSPQSTSTYYNNDGSLDEEEQQPRSNDDELLNIDIDLRKKNEMINTSNPVAATLDIGDILIFNAKIFHFGSANISTVDRLLMSFSFQKLDLNGDYIPIKGFTYHLSNSMKNENKILKHYPNIE